jgi:xanthine dehydrogenase YagT iron-sulfur-binding subunit
MPEKSGKINRSFIDAPNDPRVSVLDLLREHLQLSGTKEGCNQGAVRGVHGAGRWRSHSLSCLALAVQFEVNLRFAF